MTISRPNPRSRRCPAALCGLVLLGAAAMTHAADETLIDPTTAPRQLMVESLSAAPQPGVAGGGTALALPVEFDLDSANLTPQGRAILDIMASLMNDPALIAATFILEGHTDVSGSPAHNLKLSQRRADSVREYLGTHGVATARLSAAGFGSNRPLPNLTPADGRNRRVTIAREF